MSDLSKVLRLVASNIEDVYPFEVAVGQALKILRKKNKLNQTELGELMSISQTSIHRLETANQHMTVLQLHHFLDLFGSNYTDFMKLVDFLMTPDVVVLQALT